MIQISYKRDIFEPDHNDLAPGAVLPVGAKGPADERALFYAGTLCGFSVETCPKHFLTHLATHTEAPTALNDLFRRLGAGRFPRYARLFFDDDQIHHSPVGIRESLVRMWQWAVEDGSAATARVWAISSRAAGVRESGLAARWLEKFSAALHAGTSVPIPGSEEQFDLAVRWAGAAVPEIPRPIWNGNGVEDLSCASVGREAFLERWWPSPLGRAEAWRAAIWLASREPGVWRHLLEGVVGITLRGPFASAAVELPAPHGADHLAALVGSGSAGKTSLLCTLAKDLSGPSGTGAFQYQRMNGDSTGWENVCEDWEPRSRWAEGSPFATRPSHQLTRRGFDGRLTDGIRLLAYDVAGELLDPSGPAMEAFSKFIRRFAPTALVVILGRKSDLTSHVQLCHNLCQVVESLPESPEWPVKVFFNFSDERFAPGDSRRSTLLGPEPMHCATEELLGEGGERSAATLLTRMAESRQWARYPAEALAFEEAISDFAPALDLLLPRFRRLHLAFVCCAGSAPELRRSAAAHWNSLTRSVSAVTRKSTTESLRRQFGIRAAQVVREMAQLRIMGERLSALLPPTMRVEAPAEQRARADWAGLKAAAAGAFADCLRNTEDDFHALAKSLPGTGEWANLQPGSAKDRIFGWLLASLGIPVDLGIPFDSLPGPVTHPGKWSGGSADGGGWSGPFRFSCRWDRGATTIPSEWNNGNGPTKLMELANRLAFQGNVSELLARCLKEPGNPECQAGVEIVIRALTHADLRHGRGLFPEQSLEPHSPDVYAFAAINSEARSFRHSASVARCQGLVVDILRQGAALRAMALPDLQETMRTAWRLRLLSVERNDAGGGPLEVEHLKTDWLSSFEDGARPALVRTLRSLGGKLWRKQEVARWLRMDQTQPEFHTLVTVAALGKDLIQLVDERLAGFFHAKLSYAKACGWFPEKDAQISWLKDQLERRTKTPWALYAGSPVELGAANARTYQALFPAE